MIFIWNGIDYKAVADEEFAKNAADIHNYVIVRRLFVSALKPNHSEDYLYKYFNKYGKIESIKMLKSGDECYVTFDSDRDAYSALMAEKEKDCSQINTEIAHPWRQPAYETTALWLLFGCDVNEKCFPVHKTLLEKQSVVLKAMFDGALKEGKHEIRIDDVDAGEFTKFAKFLYTPHTANISLQNVEALLKLAKKYKIKKLLSAGDKFIIEIANIFMGYDLAVRYNRLLVKKQLEAKISENAKKLFETVEFQLCSRETLENILAIDELMCDPRNVFDACIDWASNASRIHWETGISDMVNVKKQLGECFYQIPFSLMQPKQITQIVNEYNELFDCDELVDLINIMSSSGRVSLFKTVSNITKPDSSTEAVLKNHKIIYEVLNNLEVKDLLNAYNVDKNFRSAVLKVIGNKIIEFDKLDRKYAAKVFNLFGEFMTRLQIVDWDVASYPANVEFKKSGYVEYTNLDKLIGVLTKYCNPKKLQTIQIELSTRPFSQHTEQLLQQARPFENLDSIKIYNYYNNDEDRDTERILLSSAFPNLQHVYIPFSCAWSDDFASFFKLHRNLKTFSCPFNEHLDLESIARYAPSIESISYFGIVSREKLQYFREFSQLKHVGINVYDSKGRDLFEIMEKIPNKHLLEVLSLYLPESPNDFNEPTFMLPTIMQQFENLKWLRLIKLEDCSNILLSIVLPQLNKVTKCSMLRYYRWSQLLMVVQLLANLHVVVTEQVTITKKMYQKLKRIWEKRQLEEEFTYPIVIEMGIGSSGTSRYGISMTNCQKIYDANIIRLQQTSISESTEIFNYCQ